MEIAAARWVPLKDLTSNEEGVEYKMFPNAFKFMQTLQNWLLKVKNNKLDLVRDLE